MKNVIRSLIVMASLFMLFGCGGGDSGETEDVDKRVDWPKDFNLTSYTTGYGTDYETLDGARLMLRDLDNGETKFFKDWEKDVDDQEMIYFDLISVEGKKLTIKITDTRNYPSVKIDKKYVLCDSYTVNDGTLTFTGGEIKDISDLTWTEVD